MKKLYRKGTVHPSPPPPLITDQLSFLPHAILTLTVALSPEDREVLAYLISCSSSNNNNNNINLSSAKPRRIPNNKASTIVIDGDHPPLFNCTCFRCYMSYWVRWDSSPNHQLIHEVIDAFEDWLAQNNNKASNKNKGNEKKEKRNKRGSSSKKSAADELICSAPRKESHPESEAVVESSNSGGEDGGGGGGGDEVEVEEKGAVRRFVGFIGERIWGAWGQ